MLEGLHRLLANRYQFTISERSVQNLEADMADSDNLTQFMQATAYEMCIRDRCDALCIRAASRCAVADNSDCPVLLPNQ